MKRTFYVDADEEVISVINKIKKTKVKNLSLVVPQRSLLIQSIVNLKLLKKEAEKIKKNIILVTKDKYGKVLAERAGFEVQEMNDENEEDIKEGFQPKIKKSKKPTKGVKQKKRLKYLGSDEFYSGDDLSQVENIKNDQRKKKNKKKKNKYKKENELNLEERKEKEFQDLFNRKNKKEKDTKKVVNNNKDEILVSRRIKKGFLFFGLICILVLTGFGIYFFIPSASIDITLDKNLMEEDFNIRGGKVNLDKNKKVIPIKVIEKEDELTLSYDTTGKITISDQKSRGSVIIYNEYSDEPQPLVATTRLLTEDGKLFRLAEGVIVPGMKKMEDEIKPGAIGATIVSDQEGEEYNINPTTFKIPGFEGGPKYDKFYAKSVKKMIGGGSEGKKVSAVSKSDIIRAKNKTKEALRKKIEKEIKNELNEDMTIVEDCIQIETEKFNSFPGIGVASDNFDYTVKMKAKALVFSEKDLNEILEYQFDQKNIDKSKKLNRISIEYGQAIADFEKNEIVINIHSKALYQPEIDLKQFKENVLGKNEEELKEIIISENKIKKVDINFQPEFFSRNIPFFENQVDIKVKDPEF